MPDTLTTLSVDDDEETTKALRSLLAGIVRTFAHASNEAMQTITVKANFKTACMSLSESSLAAVFT